MNKECEFLDLNSYSCRRFDSSREMPQGIHARACLSCIIELYLMRAREKKLYEETLIR